MLENFKSNDEFGYGFHMEEGRDYKEGHSLFSFQNCETEIDAIREMLDKYIDDTNEDTLAEFNNRRVDFAVYAIDATIINMTKKLESAREYLNQLERDGYDINHKMIQPYLDGTVLSVDEKLEIYNLYEQILIKRRKIKDVVGMLEVLIDNQTKSRNFILAMSKRKYVPKGRFEGDSSFYIGGRKDFFKEDIDEDVTRVKTDK